MGDAGAGGLSLVVEMDNAELLSSDELRETIASLSSQLLEYGAGHADAARPQVIFVQPGRRENADALRKIVAKIAPELEQIAELDFLWLPEGRYYELKNAGVAAARGDIVVFLDSDTVPEMHWLTELVKPFGDPDVIATNGYTSLLYDDFLSRIYALFWIFPLRRNDERNAARRPLVSNNCAFRREWIAANPFPQNSGFKVSCSILFERMRKQELVVCKVAAHVHHKPPRGWRFFLWRGLVTGRDADRRFKALRAEGRGRRIAHSFGRLFTAEWRAARRLFHARKVGIKIWQTPFAFALVTAFNSLAFLGQAAMAVGLVPDQVERVPDYVERS